MKCLQHISTAKDFLQGGFFHLRARRTFWDTLGRLIYLKEHKLLLVLLFNAAPQIAQMASLIGSTNLTIFVKFAHA